ncbi:MAG: hypothetical protein IJE43_13780 [Alphaproteobacteria bacterium]|nr:hypothetical protein [Alphaproteobacteria bacterium]
MKEEDILLALELRDAIEVTSGNYDNSIPADSSHSYSAWTEWCDYTYKIKDEFLQKHPDIAEKYKPMFWRSSEFTGVGGHFHLGQRDAVEITHPRTLSAPPLQILSDLFEQYLPDCNEEVKYYFLYGEKGGEKYEEDCWIKDHIIADEKVTRQVLKQVGRFEFNGEQFRRKKGTCYPVRDEQGKGYIVYTKREISPQLGFYNVCEIQEDTRKEYANQCGELSRRYKIDFEDVIRLGTDEDVLKKYKEQLDKAIEKIKQFSEQELEYLDHELSCGRARKKMALQELGITVPIEKGVDVNYMSFSQLRKTIDVSMKLAEMKKNIEGQRLSEAGIDTKKGSSLVFTTRDDSDIHKTLKDNPVLKKLAGGMDEK